MRLASEDVVQAMAGEPDPGPPWYIVALAWAFGLGVLVGVALLFAGCAGARDNAITAANVAHATEEAADAVLHDACTVPYTHATAAEVPALDVYCLPAVRAVAALRSARLAVNLAILSGAGDAELLARGAEVARAGAELAKAFATPRSTH